MALANCKGAEVLISPLEGGNNQILVITSNAYK